MQRFRFQAAGLEVPPSSRGVMIPGARTLRVTR